MDFFTVEKRIPGFAVVRTTKALSIKSRIKIAIGIIHHLSVITLPATIGPSNPTIAPKFPTSLLRAFS
jgi:hypothetical protein